MASSSIHYNFPILYQSIKAKRFIFRLVYKVENEFAKFGTPSGNVENDTKFWDFFSKLNKLLKTTQVRPYVYYVNSKILYQIINLLIHQVQ